MANEYNFIFSYFNEKEFIEFLDSLEEADSAALTTRMDRIQQLGFQEAKKLKWIKRLDKNLFEIRAYGSNNIQRAIYFKAEKGVYVVTHAFVKKTQKTPIREIKKGVGRRKTYLKKYGKL